MVPREICTVCFEKSNRYREDNAERTEVSRGHSSGKFFLSVKGRINESLQYDWERRNEQDGCGKQGKLLTKR